MTPDGLSGFALQEGISCDEFHSREAQGSGFELILDVIFRSLGAGKGAYK